MARYNKDHDTCITIRYISRYFQSLLFEFGSYVSKCVIFIYCSVYQSLNKAISFTSTVGCLFINSLFIH